MVEQKKQKNARYWTQQLSLASKRCAKWHKQGDKIVNRYIDRGADDAGRLTDAGNTGFSLNLFHSNVVTISNMLYGQVPQVSVDRKFADSQDDVARVAAEMLQRLLNADMSDNAPAYDTVLRGALQDRLLPGLGVARVRYEMTASTPPGAQEERILSESAPVEYVHWRDVLFGWSRSFQDLPWLAYRAYLTKEEMTQRFGDKNARDAQYAKEEVQTKQTGSMDSDLDSPAEKAEVWEIWDKTSREVVWLAQGVERPLDRKKDPLKLTNFYPSPPFFMANPTTSLYQPTSDFHLAQDLYNEIDLLQTRISILTMAVKAVGVYDSAAEGVQRIFTEGTDNTLIPVENWALFAEKGGLQGQIDWVPIQDIVNTLDKLIQVRDQTIGLLQQTTGMADVMRGNLDNQYEGVGQSQIKAKFGSVRIQALQDEFATFVSDLMQLKSEVISRHFDPQRIVQASNMMLSMDANLIPQAVALIKKPEEAKLRVTIRPEAVALADFAQLQNERIGFLDAISKFLHSAGPLMQEKPETEPYLLKMLQWSLSGFKGAQEIEGVMDQAIDASIKALMEKQQQPPQPDPAQAQEQAKQQGELQKIQAKGQSDMQLRQLDLQADTQTDAAQHQQKMQEIQATMEANLAGIRAKAQSDIEVEIIQSRANIAQKDAEAQAELEKDATNIAMEMSRDAAQHQRNITEKAVDFDISEAQAQRDEKTIKKQDKAK
jgi:hypothetical protein